jgi:hypothetical protein
MFFKNKEKKEERGKEGLSTVEFNEDSEYFPSQDSETQADAHTSKNISPAQSGSSGARRSYQTTPALTPRDITPTTIATEFRKLNLKMDSVVDWIRQFYSRFSGSLESINELKSRISEIEETGGSSSKSDSAEKEIYAVKQDLEDMKKRADVFIGTEELLKLNDKINSDIQQLKTMESEVREGVEKIKGVDFESLKKAGPDKITTDLLEKTAILAKQNKEAIGEFNYGDYNQKVDSILSVIEDLAEQISDIKDKLESYNRIFSFSNPPKNRGKKGKSDKAVLERTDVDLLEDIGDIPELPELPPSPSSGSSKNKKKNKK